MSSEIIDLKSKQYQVQCESCRDSDSLNQTQTEDSLDKTDEVEEDADILSYDSDDDPSWAPKNDKNQKNKAEADVVQSFIPRKRKRIGPDEIGVKKVKNITAAPTPVVAPINSTPSSSTPAPATPTTPTEKAGKVPR